MSRRLLSAIVCATGLTGADPVAPQTGGAPLRDCLDCPELVVVPAGRFLMGSPAEEAGRGEDEGPRREVILDRFALGRYEVMRGELEAYLAATGTTLQGCRVLAAGRWAPDDARSWRDPGFPQSDRHPAVCVNWDDAQGYLAWLRRRTGEDYRLPSEAEWEYAARAGTTAARFWGDDATRACTWANVADRATRRRHPTMRRLHACNDGFAYTAPAGSFAANPFGLDDLLGNVWEWVEDCWSASYAGAPVDGEAWTAGDCARRVVRGGSWGLAQEGVRSAERNWFEATYRSSVLGFRVARRLPPEPEASPPGPSSVRAPRRHRSVR